MKKATIDMYRTSSREDPGDKAAYQTPEVSVSALRLITLGGSPGSGDSGAPNSENPFGSEQPQPPGEQIVLPEEDPYM